MDEQLQQFRETWLYHAALFLFEHMQKCGLTPVPVRVSCGFPLSGGGRQNNTVVGECFKPQFCADGVSQVFVSPLLSESVQVLGVLLHELIHASFRGIYPSPHGKEFSQASKRVGLVGPPTKNVVGSALQPLLEEYVARVGPYPHAPILLKQDDKEKAPGSRLRLYQCGCEPPVKVRVASNEFLATCGRCEESFSLIEKAE